MRRMRARRLQGMGADSGSWYSSLPDQIAQAMTVYNTGEEIPADQMETANRILAERQEKQEPTVTGIPMKWLIIGGLAVLAVMYLKKK